MGKLKKISSVSFVGSGNVATHLAHGLSNIGIEIVEVYSVNPENANRFASRLNCSVAKDPDNLKEVDLIIIAVPDSKIEEVAVKFHGARSMVVHTSGITSMNSLGGNISYGVFYPLQTFSLQKDVDLKDVPFCIEANNKDNFNLLFELASRLSTNVKRLDSENRKILHLTAVMVNNFSNHLYHLAFDILKENNLDFDFLIPLIQETALKVKDIHPADAQTGPARRQDISSMKEHLRMLDSFPEFREVYKLLSEQIKKKYHE